MNRWNLLALVALVPLVGCASEAPEAKKPAAHAHADMGGKAKTDAKAEKSEEEEVKESLAQLSPEDRKLAEAQKYCANADKSLLGSMGAPVKVMVKDQPVFICCDGCKKAILKDPDATLAKVDELKKKAAGEAQK